MLRDFVNKIAEMAKVEQVEISSRPYTTKELYPLKDPRVCSMQLSTLTGIKHYLDENPDELEMGKVVVRVIDSNLVIVSSAVFGPFRQREDYIKSSTTRDNFHFGRQMSVEEFVIGLQASFVPSETVCNILKVVGNLTKGVTRNHSDDGVSQSVTVKSGITRVGEAIVPNPVSLSPYRTFAEVEQPESDFILRLKSGSDTPTCSLHEADGGAWKLTAIKRVAQWLHEKLPRGSVVIA